MGYRNKTYVIFDGDNDIWAYRFMRGWRANAHVEFDFHDAHDLNVITDRSGEENTKRKLRERFSNTKQAIVLIGESTKNLYRFVRWELEACKSLGLPILAVNLNNERMIDRDRCPAILRDSDVMHVSFNAKIIKFAMDDFFGKYNSYYSGHGEEWHYPDAIYKGLGL